MGQLSPKHLIGCIKMFFVADASCGGRGSTGRSPWSTSAAPAAAESPDATAAATAAALGSSGWPTAEQSHSAQSAAADPQHDAAEHAAGPTTRPAVTAHFQRLPAPPTAAAPNGRPRHQPVSQRQSDAAANAAATANRHAANGDERQPQLDCGAQQHFQVQRGSHGKRSLH